MSQSIVVKAIFRNNKATYVGLHNPKNNRIANEKEFKHLFDMFAKHIHPISEKFKRIDIYIWLQNGERVTCVNLDEAVRLIKRDTIQN